MKDIMTFRGDRKIWVKFVNNLREEKKEVWEIIEPMLKSYLKKKGSIKDKHGKRS